MGPFKDGWTEEDVEAVLARGIPDEILYVPIVIGMNSHVVDHVWAESICLLLASNSHTQTRCNAFTGLSHIARICGELSLERVLPVISKALNDENKEVRGYAQDTACDIHRYLGVIAPGYNPEYTEEFTAKMEKAIEELKKKNT